MTSRVLCAEIVCRVALCLGVLFPATLIAQPVPPQDGPVQGLRGHYFARDYRGRTYRLDELNIPTPLGEPSAVRVDPQISFGNGRGFDRSQGQLGWYAHPDTTAVIWTGYIRFPKAGTYYLTTASDDASAVYVDRARVALNGGFGGAIPSDAFTYADPGIGATYNARQNSYVVPVVLDGSQALPIEIRYAMVNMGSTGFGIDLYWVTPDSPRGSDGKPIAQLVPAEALLSDARLDVSPVGPTSAARSTLTADYLYYPLGIEDHATLSVRVVDAAGAPLPGRRVHISTLASYGERTVITQPDPTDSNGMTSARVELPPHVVQHTSTYFATVLDDLVDIDQVAEIVVAESSGQHFLPPAYSPYYDDGKTLRIAPEPLVVGQPATITVPLTNREDVPYSLYVSVASLESNIGAVEWNAVGTTETVVLAPGESKEVALAWTPDRPLAHICFRVVVWGNVVEQNAAALPLPDILGIAHAAGPPKPLESRQQNAGPVSDFLDWLNNKIDDLYGGGVPIGPTKLDPRTGRVSVGGEVGSVSVGDQEIASASGKASFGAAEGNDPRGDIVSGRWSFNFKWFGGGQAGASGEVSVRISDPVQQRVSSPYGGLGSQTGRAVRNYPGCDPQFPEQC